MKILFSSASGSDKGEGIHYRRVLERLGHEVCWVTAPNRGESWQEQNVPEPGLLPGTTLEAVEWLAGGGIDLFLYVEPRGLIPEGMERAPFPTACVISDVHQDLPNRQRLARFFDHVFLYQRDYRPAFAEHPAEDVHWLPYACDLKFFHPVPAGRDLDVAFIGQVHDSDDRRRLVPQIGQRWHLNEQRYYLQREIPEVYSRAKIVVNFPLNGDLNFRFFEALSCGTLLLTRRLTNGQEALFEEGKHFVAFADETELFRQIDYYLTHEAEREAIAAAGLAEVQARHSLEMRVTDLLAALQARPEKRAPVRAMSAAELDRQYAWLYEFWRLADPGLRLVKAARQAGRPWLPLVWPAARSFLRGALR